MLSVAILAFVAFFVTQLIKPVLKASILPQDKSWQNTALRGIVFLIAYILVLLNTIAQHPIDWSGAWGLLTTAGVVFAVAVASYHVLDDNPATPVFPDGTATPVTTQDVTVHLKPAPTPAPVSVPTVTTPPAAAVKTKSKATTSGTAASIILPDKPLVDEAAHPDPS